VSTLRRKMLAIAPLVALVVLFLSVLGAGRNPMWRHSIPQESFVADHCTWACHTQGCRHAPVLPAFLTSDRGAFGLTISALFAIGRVLSRDRGTGYGLANFLVFLVAWPSITYWLWLLVLRQRRTLAALRRR
jgi:hypothetical protein